MATLSPSVANFSITANSWTVITDEFDDTYYSPAISGVSAKTSAQTFNFTSIPTGSTINSATLYVTQALSGRSTHTNDLSVNGGAYTSYDTTGSPRTENVQSAIQSLITAGTKDLVVTFRFKGWDGAAPMYTGTFSNRMDYSNVYIAIDYTPPTLPYATKVWSNNQWVSGTPYVWADKGAGLAWQPGVAYVWSEKTPGAGYAWNPGLT